MEAKPQQQPYIIVVGIDYSELGSLALERAFEIASERRAEPHVIHVADGHGDLMGLDDIRPLAFEDARKKLDAYVRHELDAWIARHPTEQDRFVRVCTHQRVGSPRDEIVQIASELVADLVVVGTHGRKGVPRVLLGSVAEGVVRLAACPVLVVRPSHVEPNVPKILPLCPRCIETRKTTAGAELWCENHRGRHFARHTYHHVDRNVASSTSGLVDPLPR